MLINKLDRITVYVDGGCKANGQANPHAYGSFAVHAYGKDGTFEVGKIEHADYPALSTNNQAEYQALVDAAHYMQMLFSRMGKQFPLTFKSDSQIVVNQVLGVFKVKNSRFPVKEAQDLLKELGAKLEKEDREIIVHALGH